MESLVAAANDQHLNAGQSRSYKSYTDRNEAERVRATKATSLKLMQVWHTQKMRYWLLFTFARGTIGLKFKQETKDSKIRWTTSSVSLLFFVLVAK